MYVAFPCNLCVTVPEYAPAAKRMVDVCTMTVLPNSCPLDLCKRRGTLQIFGIVPQHLDGHPCPVLPADCLVMPSRIVSFKVFAVLNQHRALEACEGGTAQGEPPLEERPFRLGRGSVATRSRNCYGCRRHRLDRACRGRVANPRANRVFISDLFCRMGGSGGHANLVGCGGYGQAS